MAQKDPCFREVFASLATFTLIPLLLGIPQRMAAEDMLAQARALAASGHRAEALQSLKTHLVTTPGDTDARVLYGAMLSWEGLYVDARSELERVLAVNPSDPGALSALVRVELWSGRPERAEQLARKALERQPRETELLLAQARALKALHRSGETRDVLGGVLKLEPDNRQAREMQRSLEEGTRQWEASFEHSYEWLSGGQDSWRESQLSLKRWTSAGPVIARFARGERFSRVSSQGTLEFYPRIRRGTWAYLDIGYSYDSKLYPHYRVAGDLNQALGRGFEASVGYRRLGFAGPVNIYTPSLTKYHKNWLITGRMFLTPDSAGTSRSFQILSRRYFGDSSSYIGFRYGRGSSPLETRSVSDTEVLRASSFFGEVYRNFGRRWALNLRTGLSREDRLRGNNLHHYVADATLYFRF